LIHYEMIVIKVCKASIHAFASPILTLLYTIILKIE
jgi:hypothetical protein